ncbi:hypothetical protein Pan44_05460 [Caulifigura coniformis]|uniref:Uncharacterized protein n=1 Tax=Caulifigura coniformis TaxID=2527983 RepID=A0A517S8S7_9PLAN|nr:hypothetical protein [Caulifigura coniformis]QDT52534.1 hypothetical protein Pan44_05460 [Caulifigura coniformis]
MSEQTAPPRRFRVSIASLLVVNAIISLQAALFLPAVDVARVRRGEAPLLPPAISSIQSDHPWWFLACIPILTTTLLAFVSGLMRAILPVRVRRHVVWRQPPTEPSPPLDLVNEGRTSAASLLIAGLSTLLLVIVAFHARSDRTNRRPSVTWVGPLADYVLQATLAGVCLSGIALVLGCYAFARTTHRILGFIGAFIAGLNLFGCCGFYAALYED